MHQLILPARLDFAGVETLVRAWPLGPGDLTINFAHQGFVFPIGTTALSALIQRDTNAGRAIFIATEGCQNLGYWGRMGFFENFNLPHIGTPGSKHAAEGRFSEVKLVSNIFQNDDIAFGIVDVCGGSEEAKQIHSHIVSEALNNISQHARAYGYCASQHYPNMSDLVHFTMVDSGRGLKEALSGLHPTQGHMEAVEKALQPGVTGRGPAEQRLDPSAYRNRGIGLSVILRLVQGNCGSLRLWSGDAAYCATRDTVQRRVMPYWQGTLIEVALPREATSRTVGDALRDVMADLAKPTR